jgi:hypothetical protein
MAKFRHKRIGTLLFFFSVFLIFLTACQPILDLISEPETPPLSISAEQAGEVSRGSVPAGVSVSQALESLGIKYNTDDEIQPALTTTLTKDTTIRITTVTFEEQTEERIIPYISQTVRNENLPEGETFMIQLGKHGRELVTTRSTFHDGLLVAQEESKRQVLEEAQPEIQMIGVKTGQSAVQIPGKLIYISNGNAWLMQGSTSNRTPIVTSGDLDGRVLDLSSNGEWLMYSRKTHEDDINSLWMLHITDPQAVPISLRVNDVIRFAAWLPGETLRFLYSTVTPRETAPGWSANNDLRLRIVSETGMMMSNEVIIEPEEGPQPYGWWGTDYLLSEDGRTVYYADTAAIGEIDRLTSERKPLLKIQPYEKAQSDWAWIPGFSLSPDESVLYFSYHGDIRGETPTFNPADFNIGRFNRAENTVMVLLSEAGIFSQPTVSPSFEDGSYSLAYLQSLNPNQSEGNRYRIMLTDENGSNNRAVFPLESSESVIPQKLYWAPTDKIRESWIAFIHHGNIWLVNPFTGIYNQITIDQSITTIIWE